MIKPASVHCNLRCRYCFYADISENRAIPVNGMMTEETTEVITKRIAEALESKGLANISSREGNRHWKVCSISGISYHAWRSTRISE